MSTAEKRPLRELIPIADKLVVELFPLCDRIEIAGSIRRHCDLVGDIEIVAIPKIEKRVKPGGEDLFGEGRGIYEHVNKLWAACDLALETGRIQHTEKKAWGDKYRRFISEGVKVDLFTAEQGNFGNILMIRTGSELFSKQMMLQLQLHGLTSLDGYIIRQHDRVRIPTPTEQDVFLQARMPWIAPEKRSV